MLSKKRWHQRSMVAKGLMWFMSFYLVLPAFTPWGWSAMAADAAAPAAAPAAVQPAAELPALPAAELVVGAMGGDEEIESFGSILAPVYSTGSGIFFVSPKMTFGEDDQKEMNLGVGYRQLFGDYNVIAGVNAYYDKRWTLFDNQFEQYGVGVEVLTEWVDARANFYFADDGAKLADAYSTTTESSSTSIEGDDPYATGNTIYQHVEETRRTTVTTHIFEMYEQARDGFDAEIGVKLPYVDQWTEVRVFGGYYKWDGAFEEEDDVDGFKARIEVRALPILYIDAAYVEDKELDGQEWTAGARVNIPFDLANLAAGKNPFEGCLDRAKPGKTPFAARITEQVMRDLKVRMAYSEFNENPGRQTSESHSRTVASWEEPLMEDIMFVDQDRGADTNPGTYERPKLTIQNGADNAFGEKNVYVDSARGSYNENVIVPDNVKLYASGTRIEGISGKYFGTDTPPVVLGDGIEPTFTISSPLSIHGTTATIAGFDIQSTGGGAEGIYGDFPNPDGPVSLTIKDNIIDGALQGIFLYGQAENFTANLVNNSIENSVGNGAYVHVWGASGTFDMTVRGGSFNDNGANGLWIQAANYDTASITISGVQANNNLNGFGVYASLDIDGDATISINNTEASYNEGAYAGVGIAAFTYSYVDGNATVTMDGVTANGNENADPTLGFAGGGIAASATTKGAGSALVALSDVEANDNVGAQAYSFGVLAKAYAYGTGNATVTMDGIEANNTGYYGDGVTAVVQTYGNGTASITLTDVTANYNEDDGVGAWAAVYGDGVDVSGTASITMMNITANYNEDDGVDAGAYVGAYNTADVVSGTASITMRNITANYNEDDGVYAEAEVYADGDVVSGSALITMRGVTANYNEDDGVDAEAQVYANANVASGSASVTMRNVTASYNDEYGVYAWAGIEATVAM